MKRRAGVGVKEKRLGKTYCQIYLELDEKRRFLCRYDDLFRCFCDNSRLKGGLDCPPESRSSGVKSCATNKTVLQDPAV